MKKILDEISINIYENAKNKFFIKTYKIVCIVKDEIILPEFWGSILRGAFGRNLKRVSCLNKKERNCFECKFRNICVYFYTFESSFENNKPDFLKNVEYIPHPFILEPSFNKKNIYLKNEKFEFNLILIGLKTNYYLPFYISAIIKMGQFGLFNNENSRFELEKIETIDLKNVYSINEGFKFDFKFENDIKIINEEIPKNSINEITINFLTPTRIVNNGKYISEPSFYIYFKSILSRFISLSYIYNELIIEKPKDLIIHSKKIKIKKSKLYWYDWETFSGRQKNIIKLGGIIGNIIYEGDIKPFLPFIIIGKYIHIGKNTSYGLGKYNFLL